MYPLLQMHKEQHRYILKLSEKIELCGLEDECIVLEDERADYIYGGKFVCFGSYNNCSFGNCA